MKIIKQVSKDHYSFLSYMNKERWNSVWHQIHITTQLNPRNILEIGTGNGLFKLFISHCIDNTQTLDIDPELNPDILGTVKAIPFKDNSFDAVCAFQVLEHLPYNDALISFSEMMRVSRKHVILSLPDSRPVYQIHIPKLRINCLLLPRPFRKLKEHKFNGEHYWEINKKGYSLNKIIADLTKSGILIKTYQLYENPYHRFFLFRKRS